MGGEGGARDTIGATLPDELTSAFDPCAGFGGVVDVLPHIMKNTMSPRDNAPMPPPSTKIHGAVECVGFGDVAAADIDVDSGN